MPTALARDVFQALETRRLLSAGPIDLDGAPAEGFSDVPAEVVNQYEGELHASPVPDNIPDFGDDGSGGPAEGPFPDGQTFLLNSRPGASKVVYLDFDGHTTSSTSWNFQFTGGAPIVTPAYSLDSNTNSFTSTELGRIQEIWRRVSEDYAPFDVNVTTQFPGDDFLRRSGGGDQEWGIRVVIGGRSSDWYGNAGGVAYVGSFDATNDTPAFVFSATLGGGETTVAEATSHEAGHTLGLYHDGQSPGDGEYYFGHNSGAGGWAPIMGVGYYEPITQWSRGEYRNATQFQNDVPIIASSTNGFGYRPDDHSDDFGFADPTPVVPTPSGAFAADGRITTQNDQDGFRFEHGGGLLSVNADAFERGPNLDIGLELYRWNGSSYALVASDDPANSLDASVSGDFPAGTYLARVDGVGTGNPQASNPTGYTDYGSLGVYTLSGTVASINDPFPDLPNGFAQGDLEASLPLLHTGGNNDAVVDGNLNLNQAGDVDFLAFGTDYSGDVTVDVTGTGGVDPVLGLYELDSAGNFVRVAADDDSGGNGNPRLTFAAVGRQRYALAVADVGGDDAGELAITLSSAASFTPNLITLGGGGLGTGGANVNPQEDTDYFVFTAGGDTATISLTKTSGDAAFAPAALAYDAAGNPLGDAVAVGGSGATDTIDLSGLTAGQDVYLAVFGEFFGGGGGSFDLAVESAPDAGDPIGPRVGDLFVRGSAWTAAYRDAVGDPALGYDVPVGNGQNQLRALGWANLDTVSLVFDEPVNIASADALDVRVNGTEVAMAANGFSYDAATLTATWRTAQPIGRGNVTFALDDALVADLDGNALDGEFDNPSGPADGASGLLPSGNGTAGGDFAFDLRVLPGNATADAAVNLSDFTALSGAFGRTVGQGAYNPFTDFNGDGQVNLSDFTILSGNFGTNL